MSSIRPIHLLRATHERPQRLVAGAVGGLILGIFFLIGAATLFGRLGGMVGVGALIALPIVLGRRYGRKQVGGTEMTVEDGRVHIPALDLSLQTSDIRNGLESAAAQTIVLDLNRGGETVHLQLAPAKKNEVDYRGEQILSQLGVGPLQRTTRVPLRRTLGRFSIGLVTFLCALFPAAFLIPVVKAIAGAMAPLGAMGLVVGVASLITWLVVRRFGSPHVVVGSDGLQLRGLWNQSFIPYADIAKVEYHKAVNTELVSLVIQLRDGRSRSLPMVAIGRDRVTGLIERIERARKRNTGEDNGNRISDALRRAGKSLTEWREELTRLATRQASFREAAVERDEIENILADPDASAEQRIGAAYVLYRIDPEVGKERVRIAADATAGDDLRDALQAAAEGEMETPAIDRSSRRV